MWVIDQTNQRGNEVYKRNVAGRAMPRWLAENYIRWLRGQFPEHYYAVREEGEGGEARQ